MATTETRRTPKRATAKTPAPPAPAVEEREPRGARRKRETRARLLDAALRLMADRGMEGVAINEITEAADVGFGSFYNHFESKEAIYAALVSSVFEEFADSLDKVTEGLADPDVPSRSRPASDAISEAATSAPARIRLTRMPARRATSRLRPTTSIR